MRAHYHDFKEQPYTNYKSTYANQYTAKDNDQPHLTHVKHAQNAISFGNHQLPLITTNNASFTPKYLEQQSHKSSQPTLGIVLGDKSQPMETINQQYYTRK